MKKRRRESKIRLDSLLVLRGLAESKTKAQSFVMAGLVFSGECRLNKAGQLMSSDVKLEVRHVAVKWVSRGGLKLEHGLSFFGIGVLGRVCLDIGVSTGGFTDVLLHLGARLVYAVDVGFGQLAWKLRNDRRVIVLERTNARYLTEDEIPSEVDLIVCDASFISLRTILPAALVFARPGAHLLALIKPQFEVGKEFVGKGGIVRDKALHAEVCQRIYDWINAREGWSAIGITESPIKGAAGNQEFLIAAVVNK